ncbi:MAG: penicillin-binding protein 2 [Candidatus Wildermuthbacteria bacterium]|nr:penicillin-binding protein 2 [Candidatus Wildermuthbacteria bacterium]
MKQWKFIAVLCLFLAAGAAIIGRLVFLQVINQGSYRAFAQGQQNAAGMQKGERGTIYATDRDGNWYALAANREIAYAFASPSEIQNKEETAKAVSAVLGLEESAVFKKLQNEESLYEVLKKEVAQEEAKQIKELGIKGIYAGSKSARFYPQDSMASQVIGFVNQEGEGQYGVEEYYNDILKGKEGMVKNSRNPASFLLFGSRSQAKDGSDIVLTIDYNIQATAETLLANSKESLGFEEGTIIVMEPLTGKILALANNPSFNPNSYALAKDPAVFQNSATQKIFEPGSIFKPVTMAAAIDTGSVTPDTAYTDNGILKVGGYTVSNYDQRTWGERTMKQVLEFSINTGVAFAESQMGHQNFLRYIERFGFFEPTRIDLPGEAYSLNKAFRQGYEINFTTASFGQGIEMTLMQIARAFAAILNGGVMPDVSIAESAVDSQGAITTLHKTSAPQRSVISQKTASQITDMLVGVVEEGYGKKAKMKGYYTAGKTGTAQVSFSSLGTQKAGYSDKTIQSFIGYAPAFNPRFLILVKLNNPKTKTAEYSAIPIFAKLQKYIIDYYQIPPDYEP